MRKLIFVLLAAATFLVSAAPAIATENEYKEMYWSLMQSCPDVKGEVVAEYRNSWNWIVGFSPNQYGNDKVWHVGYDNYIQCFCPVKLAGFTPLFTNGVKTVWLKQSNLTVDQITQRQSNSRWIYVANGADFGLKPEPYWALNDPWDCKDRCPGM